MTRRGGLVYIALHLSKHSQKDCLKTVTGRKFIVNLREFRTSSIVPRVGVTAAALAIAFLLVSVSTSTAHAQTYQVIHTFSGPDGAIPVAGLNIDRGGKLYGTVRTGHSGSNWGGAFQLRRGGTGWLFNTLQIFDGTISSRVIFGPNGTLYGTSPNNIAGHPYGYIYNLAPPVNACTSALCPWNFSLLYPFSGGIEGATPLYGDITFDQSGNMYGTTILGGSGVGVVYEMTLSGGQWTEQPIYTFAGSPDGATPYAGVIFDTAGNLYGTTTAGGASGNGTVFELSPSGGGWTEQVIYNFQGGADGGDPVGGLIFDASGNLYGATASGGTGSGGTVFELSPNGSSWTHNVLYNFNGTAACGPWGLLTLQSGNLYGTTKCDGANSDGNVWQLTSSGSNWTYSSLYDFTGADDGKEPYGNVIFDPSGNVYGTASLGGQHQVGVVWEITP